MASKIIVMGAVNGALRDAFSRLAKIQAKSKLSFAILLGDLFGEESQAAGNEELTALLNGEVTVPLATYFTVGSRTLPQRVLEKLEKNDDQLCPNLFFLGRRTTFKTSEGVRIVNVGGTYAEQDPTVAGAQSRFLPFFTENDARVLHGAHSCDILLTNEWPNSIINGSRDAEKLRLDSLPASQTCLSTLCSTLRPRYHFTTSPSVYFEREAFFHLPNESNPDIRPVTRFLNLGSFKNPAGAKFNYAFSIDPFESLPTSTTPLPPGTTACPFASLAQKRRAPIESQQDSYSRFNGHPPKQYRTGDSQTYGRRRGPRAAPAGPEACFFCLSNPNIKTHLVTSIGEDSYLTISRGPLPTMTTFPPLQGRFPGHMLIIPFAHSSSLSTIPDPEVRTKTFAEMSRYRKAMTAMLHRLSSNTTTPPTTSNPPEHQPLGSICWDLSRSGVRHFAWQWMPVPGAYVTRGLVDGAFRVKAESSALPPFAPIDPADDVPPQTGDYFRVWIGGPAEPGSEVSESSLLMPIPAEQSFNIQFGREVMASLLRLNERLDWRAVMQSDAEEEAAAAAFKETFKEFDFALDE